MRPGRSPRSPRWRGPIVDALSRGSGRDDAPGADRPRAGAVCRQAQRARSPSRCSARRARSARPIAPGVGKAMLAFLAEAAGAGAAAAVVPPLHRADADTPAQALRDELAGIRARGYAFDDEEHERGIICIAVPILTRSGRVLGALSVTSTDRADDAGGAGARLRRPCDTRRWPLRRRSESWRFPDETKHAGRTGTG